MLPMRKPVIGWSVRLEPYSAGSTSSSLRTAGVIHPPQTLWLGKWLLSRTIVSSPPSTNFRAQEEPAGPPPTIRISHESIHDPFARLVARNKGERGSREFSCISRRQKPTGTIAGCPRETRRWNRRDTVATLWRFRFRAIGQLFPKTARIHRATAREFLRSGFADSQRPAPRNPKAREWSRLGPRTARRRLGKCVFESRG